LRFYPEHEYVLALGSNGLQMCRRKDPVRWKSRLHFDGDSGVEFKQAASAFLRVEW
jgi:hypothetical protein